MTSDIWGEFLLEIDTPAGWLDVTGPSTSLKCPRQAAQPSTLAVEVLDATLDPTQTDQVRMGKAARVSVRDAAGTGWQAIYTGSLDDVQVSRSPLAKPGKTVKVTFSAVDNVSTLANTPERRGVATIDDLRWLVVGVPFVINGSSAALPEGETIAGNDNASLWDQVLITRDTNLGFAWIDGAGRLQVWDADTIDDTPAATIGPDRYSSLDTDFALDQVVNSVSIVFRRFNIGTDTSADVTYGPYEDADSIAQWGRRSASFTIQAAVEDEVAIADYAAAILARTADATLRPRAARVPINSAADLDLIRDVDLCSAVDVVLHDGVTTMPARVAGIEHEVSSAGWFTTFTFESIESTAQTLSTPGTGISVIPPGAVGTPELSDDVVTVLTSADGKSRLYFADDPPVDDGSFRDGFTWFDTNNDNRMSQWVTGVGWVLELFDTAAIADAAIATAKLENSAVINAKLGNLAVDTRVLADTAVATSKIQNLAVTTSLIAGLAVDAGKIADGAATTTKIGDAAITNAKIGNLAVSTAQIQLLGVTSALIANLAVANGKIADLAVTNAKVADATIITAKIGDLQVTTAKVANLNVTTALIADLAVGSAKIANLAVGQAQIADAAIVSAKIGNLQVTNAHIADATIQSAKIANLDAGKIVAGSTFTNDLSVASKFTLGTASTSGTIESYGYATAANGFQLTKAGFTLKGGNITGSTVTSATIRTGASGARGEFTSTSSINGTTQGALSFYNNAGTVFAEMSARSDGLYGTGAISLNHTTGTYLTVSASGVTAQGGFNVTGGGIDVTGSGTITGTFSSQASITCDSNGTGGGFVDGNYVGGGTSTASVNNNGRIVRTSTRDMKEAIKPMTAREAHSVLGLESYTFRYKREDGMPADPRRYPGFIAEQGAEVGAELWVARQHKVTRRKGGVRSIKRDRNGKPIAFRTADVTVAHNVLIRELFDRVEALEAEVAALTA